MPKARKYKKAAASGGRRAPAPQGGRVDSTARAGVVRDRRFVSPTTRGPLSLLMPALVALGCWGLAFAFAVLSNEPNHILFGAMSALLALLWTVSVVVRVRKLRLLRQKS